MKYAPELLSAIPTSFRATTEAHGLYSTNQFVLRLSPLVHRALAEAPPGISSGKTTFDAIQAMSTFLHETVHWWQHIGSTYGFIYGMAYPVQSHANYNQLRQLLAGDGFRKSILSQSNLLNNSGPTGFGTLAGTANEIVNNHFDLETFRLFTLGPEAARTLVDNPRFEAVGHALHMTYAATIGALATTIDSNFKALPDFREWKDGFVDLRNRRQRGYYYGSAIELWPVGSHEIFEGQARFAQIQYLACCSGMRAEWQDFANLGMLDGIYVKAFREFLQLTDSEWPTDISDPLVPLFLLVCDLAINPASGFPIGVAPNFATFIEDVTPGARFTFFCRHIPNDFPSMKSAVRKHDRNEYEELAGALSEKNKDASPLSIAQLCGLWFQPTGPLGHLRSEHDQYIFEPKNYVLRHLFAHFLAFQQDKFEAPEFFCWPGFHMAGQRVSERSTSLFDRHGALFIDKEDDDSVFPRVQQERTETEVDEVFQNFYAINVTYDLVRQWINEDGPFRYDLRWLKMYSSHQEQAEFMRRHFKTAFGVDPDEAEILPPWRESLGVNVD